MYITRNVEPARLERRIMVVLFFAALLAKLLDATAYGALSHHAINAVGMLWFFGTMIFLAFIVFRAKRYLVWGDVPVLRYLRADAGAFRFDERDAERRGRVLALSHQVTCVMFVGLALARLLEEEFVAAANRLDDAAMPVRWAVLSGDLATQLLWLILAVALFLPTLLLLWTEPDPSAAEATR